MQYGQPVLVLSVWYGQYGHSALSVVSCGRPKFNCNSTTDFNPIPSKVSRYSLRMLVHQVCRLKIIFFGLELVILFVTCAG